MGNERRTEIIVRNHFNSYENIYIEEQKSENPKIQKLLKTASKNGNKHGLPEFIISLKDNRDLLIVIECKSNPSKHQSKDLECYSDYAVDGALLYASYLAKDFDVIAIGVSGETLSEIKISHFLHLKGTPKALPYYGNKLLDPQSYIDEYLNSPEKFRQDYNSLLAFSKTLNQTLHSKKIKESQRSLLISGILIALENAPFRLTYKLHGTPEVLADTLVTTITQELKKANLPIKKLDNLNSAYNFIRTHTALSGEANALADIIESIDLSVNNFIKTHKYFDVLGQFYIEFLRYANSDKGLGIVLTPPHITELFAELANVNKDSVVLDNCTGTGGFLISAMSKMVADAKGDSVKIASIKERQLIGIEWQDDIFALACSNMFIHQDGKTNIIHGSCFDEKNINLVSTFKPNVGLLNPPYPNVDTDRSELEFVLNNLDSLQPNGVCVAIIPMSCCLSNRGVDLLLKTKLLESHTLEAVLSMPDQLFYNNDVGVVTSILVITAHKKHPVNKKTWFGYFKDDGFKVRKHKGRTDYLDQWQHIKKQWLSAYTNREIIDGLSIGKIVGPADEWCAEAYMETNYDQLTTDVFINEMRKYAAFKIITSSVE